MNLRILPVTLLTLLALTSVASAKDPLYEAPTYNESVCANYTDLANSCTTTPNLAFAPKDSAYTDVVRACTQYKFCAAAATADKANLVALARRRDFDLAEYYLTGFEGLDVGKNTPAVEVAAPSELINVCRVAVLECSILDQNLSEVACITTQLCTDYGITIDGVGRNGLAAVQILSDPPAHLPIDKSTVDKLKKPLTEPLSRNVSPTGQALDQLAPAPAATPNPSK